MKSFIIWLIIGMVVGIGLLFIKTEIGFEAISNIKEKEVTLLFVGDIMLDRGVRMVLDREGDDYAFRDIRSLLTSADLTVGNLEGTFTDNQTVSNSERFQFTFDPSLSAMLKNFGFDGFSLANNHALDFGRDGLKNTQGILEEQEMFNFGSPNNDSNLSKKVTISGKTFCFVGYHQLFSPSTTSVITELNNLKEECEYLIVFAHWGEEYQDFENESQRNIGHAFVDAGADLVIGAHPHVVQPVEIYKDKAIFYSLGNFLFDQNFSLATRQGLALRLTLTKDSQNFHLIPVEMSRAHLYYPEKEAYQPRMNILLSKLPAPLRTQADVNSIFSLPR